MLDPILEKSNISSLSRSTRIKREPRIPSGFERWAWSPIHAFRIGLTLSYLGTVYFGVSALTSGVPAFRIAAPDGWTPIWASVLLFGAIVASVGSVKDTKKFRLCETVGAAAIFLTLGGYAATVLFIAYAIGDVDRVTAGAGFAALSVQPFVRLLWLLSQLGRINLSAVHHARE